MYENTPLTEASQLPKISKAGPIEVWLRTLAQTINVQHLHGNIPASHHSWNL